MQRFLQKSESILFTLLLLFLPTQFGKHFWPDFSLLQGIRVDYLSPTIYVTDLIVLLLVLTRTLNQSINNKHEKHFEFLSFNKSTLLRIFTINLVVYVSFIVYLFYNALFSGNIWNGIYHLIRFLEFSFVAYYIATTTHSLWKVKRIFLLLSFSAIGECFLAIAQFVKQGSIGGFLYLLGERTFTGQTPGIANAGINGELLLRSYGTFPHPNVLAGFLLCVMTMSLFAYSFSKGFPRVIFLCSLFFGTGALLLTMSRVSIVLWMIVLIFSLCYFQAKKRIKRSEVVTIFFLCCFFIAGVIWSPIGSRLLQSHLTEESVTQRQLLTDKSLAMIKEHPFVGVGFGNYLPSLSHMQTSFPRGTYLQPVHTIFLLTFAELGIIGFFFFLVLLFKTYQRVFQQKTIFYQDLRYCLVIIFSCIILLGLVDHYWITLQQGQLLFATVIGLCWITLRKSYYFNARKG